MPQEVETRHGARSCALALATALVAGSGAGALPGHGGGHDVLVRAATPVTFVADGGEAQVGFRVEVADGGQLAHQVVAAWSTARGTATPGDDYTPASGQVVFPAGTPSGTELTVAIQIADTAGRETAETIPLTLTLTPASRDVGLGAGPFVVVDAHDLPYLDPALPAETRVADLLARMTLDEKAGQLTQAERGDVAGDPAGVARLGLGSVYAAPGSAPVPNTAAGWADTVDGLQSHARATRLQVPLLVAADAVHGHGNLPGATLPPHNIGLGATRDAALVGALDAMVRKELAATGVTWPLSPGPAVTDVRSGRFYESLGTDPAAMAALEGARAPGPTDALDRRALEGPVTPDDLAAAVALGADTFYAPGQAPRIRDALVGAVQSGALPPAVLDAAVGQVLAAKLALGLFERPFTDRSALATVGSPEHRALARQGVAESQVLLKDDDVLPLEAGQPLYVAGRSADDLGNQAGGWTVTWQGSSGSPTAGTTILGGLLEHGAQVTFSADASAPLDGYDTAVVVVGETPYAGAFGDVGGPRWAWDRADAGRMREPKSLDLQPGDAAVVQKVCSAVPACVVVVVSGRPQAFDASAADAVVAAWLPGTEGGGVADVLFGTVPFTGTLPVPWPL